MTPSTSDLDIDIESSQEAISEEYGLVGSGGSSAYPSSKGAVRLLTKSTAIQYAGEGIRANSVHPGIINTPMTEASLADPERNRRWISATPLGRRGERDDAAVAITCQKPE